LTHQTRNMKNKNIQHAFERLATKITRATGSTGAFLLASLIIIGWIVTGPIFKFSDTWQLVINTGTTIITFLMVFLIQKTQNKDSIAIQIKLNELIAASEKASNRLIDAEELTEEELLTLEKHYAKLAAMTRKERDLQSSHSIEEAVKRHQEKFS